jgi:predicted enzyme related to lactoylglutathione lyase
VGTSSGPGAIVWHDLTVPDAEKLRSFYAEVAGWTPQPQDMGGYSDYCMNTPGGETVAGVCHAHGPNAKIPPQWLIYIAVANVEEAARACIRLGGEIIDGPRTMSGQKVCVIRDPAGAVAALAGP